MNPNDDTIKMNDKSQIKDEITYRTSLLVRNMLKRKELLETVEELTKNIDANLHVISLLNQSLKEG